MVAGGAYSIRERLVRRTRRSEGIFATHQRPSFVETYHITIQSLLTQPYVSRAKHTLGQTPCKLKTARFLPYLAISPPFRTATSVPIDTYGLEKVRAFFIDLPRSVDPTWA